MTERDYPWYSIVSGNAIQQGDLLHDCPMLGPIDAAALAEQRVQIPIYHVTAIVMSQSCDLVVREDGKPKIDQVILCPAYEKSKAIEDGFSTNRWEHARRGQLPRYHVLNRCELAGHESDFRVIDLANLFSLPFKLVSGIAEQRGERIRLNPPYREHMAQAFARFFMRVGLPVALDD